MIKLNNKNITYVALADSNNSVKGVKEIWYADTNNSVKLVYRRKDALIEGEDYEKYHWLKGDGDAVITHKDVNAFEVKVLELDTTGVNYAKGYIVNGGTRFTRLYIGSANSGGNYSGLLIFRDVGVVVANYRSPSLSIELGEHIIIKNTQTDQIGVFTDDVRHIKNATSDVDYVGTNIIFNQLVPHQNLYIGYLLSPNIHNLIPCKLLKPVPRWLDANGIRRQVGECGMIDLVSGKFYGNVNSNGTFTVENYYERKEWLQGRNGAYIDTKITEVNQNIIAFNAIVDGSISSQALFGAEDTTVSPYKRVFVRYNENNSKKLKIYDNNPSREVATDTIVNLVFSDDGNVYLNGDEVTTYSSPLSLMDSVLLFAAFLRNSQGTSIQNSTNMKVSYFSISSKINLIPCTLTMDLPASMDANGIARTKGTSGMWDLVSDRFYGNVANSGTFKAVNLAEGVDYEVHQYLVTEIPNGTFMDLPLNTSNFSFKRIFCDMLNVNCFWSKNALYAYHHAQYHNRIWDIKNATVYWISSTLTSINSEVTISSTSEVLEINGEEVPQVDYPPSIIKFRNANSPAATSVFKTSSITVDGIERYIPVKLLKSIPSKYDANGIARQVGECGMYDTVNDKFYGNVASSGTFSVEDDS